MSTPGRRPERRVLRALTVALAIAALAVITAGYLDRWHVEYGSDTAMIGLMAKSILEKGERPLFVWSVGYQGMLLEAYPTALFFRIFGINPFALNLTPAIYLWIALGVWTAGVRRAAGPWVAACTLVLTVFSIPMFYHLNLRTLPNYAESLCLGAIAVLICQRIAEDALEERPVSGAAGFGLGFVVGLGLYTFAITAYFFVAIGACLTLIHLRDDLRRGVRWLIASWVTPWRLARERSSAARLSGATMSALASLGAAGLVVGVAMLFLEPGRVEMFGVSTKRNPLVVTTASLGLTLLPGILYRLAASIGGSAATRRVWAAGAAGLLLGYLPALYHKFVLGGRSARRISPSGDWNDLWYRVEIFSAFHVEDLLALGPGRTWVTVLAAGFVIGAVLYFMGATLRSLIRYVAVGASAWAPMILYGLLPLVVLGMFSLSRAVADHGHRRYLGFLVPVYAVAVAWTTCDLWRRSRWLRPVLAAGLAAVVATASIRIAADLRTPRTLRFESIHRALEARQITHGYADYWLAYATMFLANEAVVLEPTYGNYGPRYGPLVRQQQRIAYVDYAPPRIRTREDRIEIAGRAYSVTERADLGDGIVLQVLEADAPKP